MSVENTQKNLQKYLKFSCTFYVRFSSACATIYNASGWRWSGNSFGLFNFLSNMKATKRVKVKDRQS